jgi:hypothetical protein
MRRSVPAAEVTRICLRRAQALDVVLDARLGGVVGQQAGQGLGVFVADVHHAGLRAVGPLRMAGSSGACIRPSTVQSTTSVLAARADTTGASLRIAPDAPVERVTGCAPANTDWQHQREHLRPDARGGQPRQFHRTGRLWLSPEWPPYRRAAAHSGAARLQSVQPGGFDQFLQHL